MQHTRSARTPLLAIAALAALAAALVSSSTPVDVVVESFVFVP